MTKRSSTLEPTHRSTAYKGRQMNPAILGMPGLFVLSNNAGWPMSFAKFKIVMVENHEI
jgi:hypothetical protein